jgi:hypothetical protein
MQDTRFPPFDLAPATPRTAQYNSLTPRSHIVAFSYSSNMGESGGWRWQLKLGGRVHIAGLPFMSAMSLSTHYSDGKCGLVSDAIRVVVLLFFRSTACLLREDQPRHLRFNSSSSSTILLSKSHNGSWHRAG